jgi:hypothetical protein
MSKKILVVLLGVALASCGQPQKTIVKIEDGLVKTRHFSIKVPTGWRVATSETTEVRDSYYPPELKPIQRFHAYDPIVFTKNIEIGIYEKLPTDLAGFMNSVKTVTRGMEFAESQESFGGLKLARIEAKNPSFRERPVAWIGETDKFYVWIFTQDTFDDLTGVVQTFTLTNPDDWKEGFVSQAETSTAAFMLVGGLYESRFAKCALPDGWKVKAETDSSVVFLPEDDAKNAASMDCSVNPYVRSDEKIDDVVKRFASALTKPAIDDVTLGKNSFKRLSNPSDGTGRAMYFIQANGKIFTFRVNALDEETTRGQNQILGGIELK